MLQRLGRPSGREPNHQDVVAIVVGDPAEHEALSLHLGAEVRAVDLDGCMHCRQPTAEIVEVDTPAIARQLVGIGHGASQHIAQATARVVPSASSPTPLSAKSGAPVLPCPPRCAYAGT